MFDKGTGVVTLPSVEGVTWVVDGKERSRAGDLAALKPGESVHITVNLDRGYYPSGDREWTFKRPNESSEPRGGIKNG